MTDQINKIMKKLISVSILLFCFVLISAQNKDQVKTQVTQQKKVPVKSQAAPQKKVPAKTQVTPQKKVPAKSQAAPCIWGKNESDPFTGVTAKTTNWEIVGYNTSMNATIKGTYNFAISENIQKKDTTYHALDKNLYFTEPLF